MTPSCPLLLACVADDFTGATDALESLTAAGLRARMFTGVPAANEITGLDAVVVATTARSLSPAQMRVALPPVFRALHELRPRHVVYKVCSTFDSSPETGSIGAAIEIWLREFPARIVPVIAGAPALGRYCVFGHLFASGSIDPEGEVFRIDRHPVMSRHPVTPMLESSLPVHLAKQTTIPVTLEDWRIPADRSPTLGLFQISWQVFAPECQLLLRDLYSQDQYAPLGALLDGYALAAGAPVFSVGSSGLTSCLGAHWQKQGLITPPANWPALESAGPVLVASGSCSAVTARQIACAVAGFAEVPFSESAAMECVNHLREGRSVILHTARGMDDPRLAAGIRPGHETGAALGTMVREVMARHPLRRVIFAGGDTSSHAVAALGVRSLEMVCPITPGAPLCRTGELEIVCKGGQAGSDDFFLRAAGQSFHS